MAPGIGQIALDGHHYLSFLRLDDVDQGAAVALEDTLPTHPGPAPVQAANGPDVPTGLGRLTLLVIPGPTAVFPIPIDPDDDALPGHEGQSRLHVRDRSDPGGTSRARTVVHGRQVAPGLPIVPTHLDGATAVAAQAQELIPSQEHEGPCRRPLGDDMESGIQKIARLAQPYGGGAHK